MFLLGYGDTMPDISSLEDVKTGSGEQHAADEDGDLVPADDGIAQGQVFQDFVAVSAEEEVGGVDARRAAEGGRNWQ
jgi:hypothetical protein